METQKSKYLKKNDVFHALHTFSIINSVFFLEHESSFLTVETVKLTVYVFWSFEPHLMVHIYFVLSLKSLYKFLNVLEINIVLPKEDAI